MTRPHVVSAAERTALRDLELLARTTVEGLRQGLHRSPFHGYAAEFSQYRRYLPGDDLKYVDWKAFARTDRLYSRQFRETTNLNALFVIDASRSMAFPESAESKFALARATAAVLATLIIDQGDAAGLLVVRDHDRLGTIYVPARSGRHHLRLSVAALAALACDGRAGIAGALRRAAALLQRRGLVVAISDFYEDDAAITELTRLARMGHEVIAVHVMAAEEIELPRAGNVELEDLETGLTRVTDTRAIAAVYEANVRAFLARTRQRIEREGMEYLPLQTSAPLEPALRRFLIQRRRAS